MPYSALKEMNLRCSAAATVSFFYHCGAIGRVRNSLREAAVEWVCGLTMSAGDGTVGEAHMLHTRRRHTSYAHHTYHTHHTHHTYMHMLMRMHMLVHMHI